MDRNAVRRVLLILWFALLWATALYWIVIEVVAREPVEVVSPVKTVLLALAAIAAAIVLYFRVSRIGALLSRATPIAPEELARLRGYYVICFALSEAAALYGLVLYFFGVSRAEVAPFFVGAVALFLVWYPKVPKAQ